MSQSPQQETGSKTYQDAWRAINVLIRSDGSWSGRERNVCYRNNGDGGFTDVAFVSGLDLDADGRSFVPFDVDGDGDLDLILKNRSGVRLRAFRNDSVGGGLLTVTLQGTESNRDGVGAKVFLWTDVGRQVREVVSGGGYLSQTSRAAQFGIPGGARVESVEVLWPSGNRDRLEDPPDAGIIRVVEGSGEWTRPSSGAEPVAGESSGLLSQSTWLAEPAPAPPIELPSLDGSWSLSEGQEAYTVLNFWASWCPPCRTELADFRDHHEAFSHAGIRVAAVSVDAPEERGAVERFAAEERLPFPVLFADDRTVNSYTIVNERLFDRRRNLAIPTSFLLDRNKRIVKVYRGGVQAEQILEDAAAGKGSALPFEGRWIESGPSRDMAELATAFADRGLTGTARIYFEEALRQGRETPELFNNYSGLLLQEGDVDEAVRYLKRSLALNSHQPNARVNLAFALSTQGRFVEAAEMAEAALSAQPDDTGALGLLAMIRSEQGDGSEAVRLLDQALLIDPTLASLHESKADIMASSGKFEVALREYERAVELGGSSVKLFSNLGVIYMQTGSPDKGLQAFKSALEAGPSDYGAHVNLALYHLNAGNHEEARAWAEKARGIDPARPEALQVLRQLP